MRPRSRLNINRGGFVLRRLNVSGGQNAKFRYVRHAKRQTAPLNSDRIGEIVRPTEKITQSYMDGSPVWSAFTF